MDLFAYKAKEQLKKTAPLADRMRPERLEDFVGQHELLGDDGVLRSLIERDQVPSMIFWGPPGTGKTTLARIIAKRTASRFVPLSATASGVAELRQAIAEADELRRLQGARTIVFIDEIHRWNKAQQDSFLPHVEEGAVTLIGATTENPSFEVNAALLSRCRVFVFQGIAPADIEALLRRALADKERGLGAAAVAAEDGALAFVADASGGDARSALNVLELAVRSTPAKRPRKNRVDSAAAKVIRLTREDVARILKRPHLLYDKSGEGHYNIISALHKSMRGSDPDAALYWLGRMLEAGEDPLYVARRLVRFASEDIGLADPQALVQANAAFQAAHSLGMPECDVCLAQAAAYLAKAPKSNALYAAYGGVKDDVRRLPNEPVPLHLRNAPTALMKELGYGVPDVDRGYMPEKLRGRKYL